jgi:hypothetical protein
MTRTYITIDTEYSSGMARRRGSACRKENFASAIMGESSKGSAGIGYQLDVFAAHGLKAVFFVDPMPALLWGVAAVADVVGPIIERGHDVQLHLHSEWLELAGQANPLGNRIGRNIKDFCLDEQCQLLEYARSVLIAAGAPRPIAFRAGNYGANDDTLRALSLLGMTHDSSHCPGIIGSDCAIGLGMQDREPVLRHGIIEVPIGCIAAAGGGVRHAQLTALSAAELLAAIRHAEASDARSFTLVSHSFELMSRDRTRINPILRRRFEKFCAGLAGLAGVSTGTYADNPPTAGTTTEPIPLLGHNPLRTGLRLAEQALANSLYGAK